MSQLNRERLAADPNSWEVVKQVDAFIKGIQNFDIEYTPDARNVAYLARFNEAEFM